MYCQHCGKEIPNNSLFCNHCGTKQIKLSQPKSPQSKYSNINNAPNQAPIPPPYYSQQNNIPQQSHQPHQPQYSSPNNVTNHVQSPMSHCPAPNNATSFSSFNTNKNFSNRNSGLIKRTSKATFVKIIATVFLSVVVISFAFSNIKKGAEKEIIGTWRDYLDSYEMTFRKDGKVIIEEDDQTIEGEYSIDSDNTLEMYFSYQGESVSMEMDYIPLDQVDRFENRNLMDEEAMWWYIEDDTLYFNSIDNMLIKD